MQRDQISVSAAAWDQMRDGRPVRLYTLANRAGLQVCATDYGCTIVSLTAPDRDGQPTDVVLGYDRLADYMANSAYMGCVVGRYANRIAAGRFTLDGRTYTLATNSASGGLPCHLHGGRLGFDKRLWESEPVTEAGAAGVRFHRRSPDGEEGYPGNLDVTVEYWLTDRNELRVEYDATCDAPTVVNLTQHMYFNLGGHDRGTILDHELMIAAERLTPVNAGLIPTGEYVPVAGTPFDFRTPTVVGLRIDAEHAQLQYGGGYDLNFVLDQRDIQRQPAATLCDPTSGRRLELFATTPGLQFYSGNFLDSSHIGKGGHPYQRRAGLCLETQHYPDSPNHAHFPSTVLRPGQQYRHTAVYRFSTR